MNSHGSSMEPWCFNGAYIAHPCYGTSMVLLHAAVWKPLIKQPLVTALAIILLFCTVQLLLHTVDALCRSAFAN